MLVAEKALPGEWRRANAIPILKREDREIVLKYRPVSLTITECKTLEKIIKKQKDEYLQRRNLPERQYGFSGRRSSITDLDSYDGMSAGLDRGDGWEDCVLDLPESF